LRKVEIVFEPEGTRFEALAGESILEAANRAGISINSPCGGAGTCGNCRVTVSEGAPAPNEEEKKHFTHGQLARGTRLACQTRIEGPMRVLIPPETRAFDQKILVEGSVRDVPLEPFVRKQSARIDEPSIEDQRSDCDRVWEKFKTGGSRPLFPNAIHRKLPRLLRESGYRLTAVFSNGMLSGLEPGDTTGVLYGAAFDIGTTTVVGYLVNLLTGELLATASQTNPQIKYGDDVVSRINYVSASPNGLEELHGLIVACINSLLEELAQAAKISLADIYEVTFAGNTTMSHLAMAVDPTFVAQAPYVAAVKIGLNMKQQELGFRINEAGNIYALPNIAGFVGGDTVAMILAVGLHLTEEITLAIDIGTNGEIVLGNRERLVVCSTAAGPAFEGARITKGMRAADGAIDRVDINGGDVSIHVIGDGKARGICGTGLIDAVAALLDAGVVNTTGLMLGPDELPEKSRGLARRLSDSPTGMQFMLASPEESVVPSGVALTQRDIREVQLAMGAIAAGTATLMTELGVEAKDIRRVVLAGAFGNYIRKDRAMRVGIIPRIPLERVRFVGNAAGAGARMALTSSPCRPEAEEISQKVQYMELAGRADFQSLFAEAMLFDTDGA